MDYHYKNNTQKGDKSSSSHKFFTIHPLSEWTVDNFIKFSQNQSRSPKPLASLKSTFLRHLQEIVKEENFPEDMKPLVQNLIKESKTKDQKVS